MNPTAPLTLGSTGIAGHRIAQRLEARGTSYRIDSRSGGRSFGWNDLEIWPGALEGMNAVYIAYQPDIAMAEAVECIASTRIAEGIGGDSQ